MRLVGFTGRHSSEHAVFLCVQLVQYVRQDREIQRALVEVLSPASRVDSIALQRFRQNTRPLCRYSFVPIIVVQTGPAHRQSPGVVRSHRISCQVVLCQGRLAATGVRFDYLHLWCAIGRQLSSSKVPSWCSQGTSSRKVLFLALSSHDTPYSAERCKSPDDLQNEREKASFSSRHLAVVLNGGPEVLQRRQENS